MSLLRRLQQFAKLFQRSGIRDIIFGQPCAASLVDAVFKNLEAIDAVRVGADDDRDTKIFRCCGVDIIKIKSTRVSIDFHHHLIVGGGFQQL